MKTILVVDDDDDIRETVAAALEDEGYDVRQAENGRVALKLLSELAQEPCLVLLDMMMPDMTGTEVLRALAEHHRLATLPVVVVSAYSGARADSAGARRIVRKPVALEILLRLVEDFCGRPVR